MTGDNDSDKVLKPIKKSTIEILKERTVELPRRTSPIKTPPREVIYVR